MTDRKIVVLVPVKNEAWNLGRFLTICETFADHIIVADQSSTDSSLEICNTYSKVHVVFNSSELFDEHHRVNLMLEKARSLVPGEKVIFCLDADEFLSANTFTSPEWKTILNAPLGTVFGFQRIEIFAFPHRMYSLKDFYFMRGFIDDGSDYEGVAIHGNLVPVKTNSKYIHFNTIKILHYSSLRRKTSLAKLRYYSILENICSSRDLLSRRKFYCEKFLEKFEQEQAKVEFQQEWLQGWINLGLDMTSYEEDLYSWHDFEVLRLFKKYKVQRFFLEDIWYFDFEQARKDALAMSISDVPNFQINRPPALLRNFLNLLVSLDQLLENFNLKLLQSLIKRLVAFAEKRLTLQ
jgi:glycosyltransferase involved in cell wall biosynthesis